MGQVLPEAVGSLRQQKVPQKVSHTGQWSGIPDLSTTEFFGQGLHFIGKRELRGSMKVNKIRLTSRLRQRLALSKPQITDCYRQCKYDLPRPGSPRQRHRTRPFPLAPWSRLSSVVTNPLSSRERRAKDTANGRKGYGLPDTGVNSGPGGQRRSNGLGANLESSGCVLPPV